MLRLVFVMVALFIIAGCATNNLPETVPSAVTVDQAMKQIGQGFREMKSALDGNDGDKVVRTGLVPSETTVTFKLTRSQDDSSKLAIDLSNPIIQDANNSGGTISAELGTAVAHEVGNTITIKLASSLSYLSKKVTEKCVTAKDDGGKDKKTCTTTTTNEIDPTALGAYKDWLAISSGSNSPLLFDAPGGNTPGLGHLFRKTPDGIDAGLISPSVRLVPKDVFTNICKACLQGGALSNEFGINNICKYIKCAAN